MKSTGSADRKMNWATLSLKRQTHGTDQTIFPTELALRVATDTLNAVLQVGVDHARDVIAHIVGKAIGGEEWVNRRDHRCRRPPRERH